MTEITGVSDYPRKIQLVMAKDLNGLFISVRVNPRGWENIKTNQREHLRPPGNSQRFCVRLFVFKNRDEKYSIIT